MAHETTLGTYSGEEITNTYRGLNLTPTKTEVQDVRSFIKSTASTPTCPMDSPGWSFISGPANEGEFDKIINWMNVNTSDLTGFARSFWFFPDQEDCIRKHVNEPAAWAIVKHGSNSYDHANGLILRILSMKKEEVEKAKNIIASLKSNSLRNLEIRAWGRCLEGNRIDFAHPFIYGENKIDGVTCVVNPQDRELTNYYLFKAVNADGEYLFPRDEPFLPTTWIDWFPISGENAWIAIAAMHIYHRTNDNNALEVAQKAAEGAMLLQAETGGIRMAPIGTWSSNSDTQRRGFFNTISTENTLSWYAVFRMLYEKTDDERYSDALNKIESYLKLAYDSEDVDDDPNNGSQPGFVQGMVYDELQKSWTKTRNFATDCQTWAIAALGVDKIDDWFSEGTAIKIWQSTKELAGVRDPESGNINGVDFTDLTKSGRNPMISYEWTAGAILAARMLEQHYREQGSLIENDTSKKQQLSNWSEEAKADAQHMTNYTINKAIRVENYCDSPPCTQSRADILGWPYASGSDLMIRRPTGFGWFAPSEEVLSLASTAWMLYIIKDKMFNPFHFNGAMSAPAELINPPEGTTIKSSSIDFEWTKGVGADEYALWIGTAPRLKDIYAVWQGKKTSVTVDNIPLTGNPIFVTLWSKMNDSWAPKDYKYTTTKKDTPPSKELARMIKPMDGETLRSSSVDFEWTKGVNVKDYVLWVGTASGFSDIYRGKQQTETSITIDNIPLTGNPVFVQLWSNIDNNWEFNAYEYQTSTIAKIINPRKGKPLSSSSIDFEWTEGTDVEQYRLWIGSAIGFSDIYQGPEGTQTSVTVNDIPLTGDTLYVRLGSSIDGIWSFNDYIYLTGELAQMIKPVDGETLRSSTIDFQWTEGVNVKDYVFWVGTASGFSDIYRGKQQTETSITIDNIPLTGNPVFVQLWSNIDNNWEFNAYEYQTSTIAKIITPRKGKPLSSSSIDFEWTEGTDVEQYRLWIGSAIGLSDIYQGPEGTQTSVTVNDIPLTGDTLYVRLGSSIDGIWSFNDYTYLTGELAQMIKPVRETLRSSTIDFQWTEGINVKDYVFWVGTASGISDIYRGKQQTETSITINNIPLTGNPVFVQLWSNIDNNWEFNAYEYQTINETPSPPKNEIAQMINPKEGETLRTSSVKFEWTEGVNVDEYALWVSTTPRNPDIYRGGLGKNTSVIVNNIPITGKPIFVTLWSMIGGKWKSIKYEYSTKKDDPPPGPKKIDLQVISGGLFNECDPKNQRPGNGCSLFFVDQENTFCPCGYELGQRGYNIQVITKKGIIKPPIHFQANFSERFDSFPTIKNMTQYLESVDSGDLVLFSISDATFYEYWVYSHPTLLKFYDTMEQKFNATKIREQRFRQSYAAILISNGNIIDEKIAEDQERIVAEGTFVIK